MRHAFTDQLASIDEQFQIALNKALSPENVQAVIDRETAARISEIIKEEVVAFFRHGHGRDVIKQAVAERMEYVYREESAK